MAGRSGSFAYTPQCYDACGNPFYFLPRSGSWSVSGALPSLNVSKNGPTEVYANERITYTLAVTGTNITGTVHITDVFEANCGYSLLDAGGGTVVTDATHITITWSTTDATWTRTLVFSPTTDCPANCGCCGQAVQNTLRASATDCRNCIVSGSASTTTYVQCDNVIAAHTREVSPSAAACETRTFTSTWTFSSSFAVTPTWQSMVFTDTLSHFDYVTDSLQVSVTDGSQTCTATFGISNTSPLVVANISPTCGITVPGATLTIIYQAKARNDFPCTGGTFYDWAYFYAGVAGGGFGCAECDNGVSSAGVFVTVLEPQMSVTISGVPDSVAACGVYTPLITLSRVGSLPAYDVQLRFPLTDYGIVEVLGFGGATPVLTTTDGISYTWSYADAFTSAVTATVQLRVQRRCNATGPLQATAYFDNLCTDDANYNHTCSTTGSRSPVVYSCYPILYKFPEIIYATGDVVTWTLTAINSGAGPAYSVTINDMLGSGLRYVTSTITSTQGSAAGVVPITSSNWITWSNLTVLPQEKYIINLVAEIINCTNLTNTVSGDQGCLDQVCHTCPPRQSHVELPPTVLINTNIMNTPIPTCITSTITATVRNAGLLSVYTATVTETLPPGLSYVPNSTEYVPGTGTTPPLTGWVSGGEPAGSPSGPLVWTQNEIPQLARLYPNQTVWVRYQVYVDCNFQGGSVIIQASYRDVCGTARTTTPSSFVTTSDPPRLTAQKQGRNLTTSSVWGSTTYADPGDSVQWQLSLNNGSTTAAYVTVVTDVLPANVTYVGASPAPDFQSGQVITWNVGTLTNTTWTALITTTVNSGQCTVTDTTDVFTATWGCPETTCRQQITAQASLRTRALFSPPTMVTDIPPATLSECGGVITVTLTNNGPPAHNVVLTDTLPAGYVYSETVYASTTPVTYPTAGVTNPVWSWGTTVLPTGITTVTFRVINDTSSGSCTVPTSGPNVLDLFYDDAASCTTTGPYITTSSTNVAVGRPVLTLTKSPHMQTSDIGQVVTWTLRVTNTGNVYAPNVVVTDALDTSFTSWGATNGSYGTTPLIVGRVITWTPAFTIPVGGVWTAQVTATVGTSGEEINFAGASATCATGCSYAAMDAEAHVTLLASFDKAPDVQTGTIGSLVTFTLDIHMSNPDDIYYNVVLTDALPTGLGYVSSVLTYTTDYDLWPSGHSTAISTTPTISPSYLSSGNIIWRLGDLTGSIKMEGIITAVVQSIAANQNGVRRTNTMTITYTEEGIGYIHRDSANVDILEPLLHLGKSYVTPYGCSATLLQDNFNSGALIPPWDNPGGGGWSVVNGVALNNANATNRRIYRGDTTWTDYSFSAIISSTDTSGDIGLIFRSQSDGNYYRFVWSRGSTNNYRLERVVSGTATTLGATAGAAYETNRWYHIEILAEGSRLRVYIDGVLVLDRTDTQWPSGRIGLYANTQNTAFFDDVLVTRLGSQSCFVGANDLITYTLTISNQSPIAGYDLLITDVVPTDLSLVSYTLTSDDPASAVTAQPSPIPGATGVLTWSVNQLASSVPYSPTQHSALTLTVVLRVADGITTNTTLSNQAALAYSSQSGAGPVGVERSYSGGSHSTAVQTAGDGLAKSVTFSPPPTLTLGSLVTYTITVPDQPITATLYNVAVTDTLDSRLQILSVTTAGGTGASAGWSGQVVTASFTSIPHDTYAYVTVTARLPHLWPSAAGDANAGDVITDVATMSHATATVTNSNQVSNVVGEPNLLLDKSVQSSTGSLNNLDGTALLTYTLTLTNSGSSPAYSVYVTDNVPAGISVTVLYGGDSHGPPIVGPGQLTWYVATISNVAPSNVTVLTYTASISQATASTWLTNTVGILYHSLTDTITGVRPYTNTDSAAVRTAGLTLDKSTAPPTLKVGDVVTYTLVYTIPAGMVGMGGNSYLKDTLPQGVWYITDSETLTWTPPGVSVAAPTRATGIAAGAQVITWTFGTPIISQQNVPTVVTLTFQAQAIGLRIDNGATLWPSQTTVYPVTNTLELWQQGAFIAQDDVQNQVIQPLLTMDKNSVPPSGSTVSAGDTITYTVVVINGGNAPAYDIVISDVLPSGIVYQGYTLSSSAGSGPPGVVVAPTVGATGVITWQIDLLNGTQAPPTGNKVLTLTISTVVSPAVSAGAVLTNTAYVPYYDSQPGPGPQTGLSPTQRTYTDGSDSVVHHTVANPAIAKTVDKATATIGEQIVYTVTVPSPVFGATLYNVVVTDVVDSRLTVNAASATGGNNGQAFVNGNTVTATWASIPANTQAYLVITATVLNIPQNVAGVVVPDVASFTWQNELGQTFPAQNSNQVSTTIVEPDVYISKSVQKPRDPLGAGDVVTYTLVFGNAAGPNNSTAYDVVISDVLPSGLTYGGVLAGTPAPTVSGSGPTALTWTIASIAPGVSLTYQFTATVNADIGPSLTLTNATSIWGSSLPGVVPGERNGDNAHDNPRYWEQSSVPVTSGRPALTITKDVQPSPAIMNAPLTYTIRVTNTGIVSATQVFVTDTVPVEGTFLSATPPYSGPDASRVITWSLGTLGVQETRTLTFTILVRDDIIEGTVITNTAWAFDHEGDHVSGTTATPVQGTPGLQLSKMANTYYVVPNQVITWTIVISNTGNVQLVTVAVTDLLPSGLSYADQARLDGTPKEPDTINGQQLVWNNVGPLSAGRTITLTFQATVTTLTPGVYTDVVHVQAIDVDQKVLVDTHTAEIELLTGDLSVSKSVQPPVVRPGDTLTYTIAYTNSGPGPALNVYVTDTLPPGVSYVGQVSASPGWTGPSVVGQSVGWYTPTLSSGASGLFVITARLSLATPVSADWVLTNTVLITATGDITPSNNIYTATNILQGLAISKSHVYTDSNQLIYYIYITNTTNVTATGIVVTDSLPSFIDPSSVQLCPNQGGHFDGVRTITWTIPSLGPGASQVLCFSARLSSAAGGQTIVNTVVGDSPQVAPPVTATDVVSLPRPIGGYIVPVSRTELLAPWLAALLVVAAAAAVMIRKRVA